MTSRKRLSKGIDVDKLDDLTLDLGIRVKVFKSTTCPNMKSIESMDHDINCKICNNNMIDFCPEETIAMFQQQSIQEQFKHHGTFHIDEVLATFKSGFTLQTFAKVQVLDFTEDFYELIQRQEGTDIDALKYEACEIVGLFTIEGTGVSQTKVEYVFGTDFTLDKNGSIKWLSRKPDDRKVYTVYYRYHPIYRAVAAVHRDRFSQYNQRPDDIDAPKIQPGDGNTYVKLPETWMLKRDYLLDRKDSETGNKLEDNKYYDPNESP